jgi:hypothetical protein
MACAGKAPPQVLPEAATVGTLDLAQKSVGPPLLHANGLGPWRLGMSRFDVLQAGNCERFEPVRVTGGFECPDWSSPLGVRRVSFVFDRRYRLEKIQMWLFDGPVDSTLPDASRRTAWAKATFQAMGAVKTLRPLTSTVNPDFLTMEEPEFIQALLDGSAESNPFSLNLRVQGDPAAVTRHWITAIASPQGAYSFLFAAR